MKQRKRRRKEQGVPKPKVPTLEQKDILYLADALYARLSSKVSDGQIEVTPTVHEGTGAPGAPIIILSRGGRMMLVYWWYVAQWIPLPHGKRFSTAMAWTCNAGRFGEGIAVTCWTLEAALDILDKALRFQLSEGRFDVGDQGPSLLSGSM